MRAEDDDVHALRIRRGKDRLGRVALPDQECRLGPRRSGAADELLDAGLDPRPLLVHAPQENTARKAKPPGVDDAEHNELSA